MLSRLQGLMAKGQLGSFAVVRCAKAEASHASRGDTGRELLDAGRQQAELARQGWGASMKYWCVSHNTATT
jgi:phosphohistidine phosphatase SixA